MTPKREPGETADLLGVEDEDRRPRHRPLAGAGPSHTATGRGGLSIKSSNRLQALPSSTARESTLKHRQHLAVFRRRLDRGPHELEGRRIQWPADIDDVDPGLGFVLGQTDSRDQQDGNGQHQAVHEGGG